MASSWQVKVEGKIPTGSPDFSGLPRILKQCGAIIIKHIVTGIQNRVQPSGMPQKKNKPSTILEKKHDHPLVGGTKGESPLLSRTNTYETTVDKDSVIITLNDQRADVGVRVEEMGYLFFDISAAAEKEALSLFWLYIKGQIDKWWKGR